MHQLSLNSFTTPSWTFQQDVDAYARAGFTGMGIYRPKVTLQQAPQARRLLHQAGLSATSICIAGFFLHTRPREQVQDAIDAIHLAAAMEAHSVVIVSGGSTSGNRLQDEAIFYVCLEELLPIAEAHHVTLALEPLHPMYAHISFLNTLDDTLNILRHFDSPWLQVVVDLYHLWWDQRLPGTLAKITNRIACVHVADWREPRSMNDRARIGHGIMPLKKLLSLFPTLGYTGFYEAEVLSDELWEQLGPELISTCYSDLCSVLS